MKSKTLTLFAAIFLTMATFTQAATNNLSSALQKGLFEEEANHNLDAAAQAYQSVAAQFDKDRKVAATAIFRLGEVYRKQGKTNEANAQYERILKEFSDQTELAKLSRNLGTANKPSDQNLDKLRELEQLRLQAQSDYDDRKATLATLKTLTRDQLKKSIPTIYPFAKFDDLLDRLESAEQQLTALQQEYTNEHVEVKKTQAIVKLIRTQLDEKIDGILFGLETQLAISKARVEQLQNQMIEARKEHSEQTLSMRKSQEQAESAVSSEDQEIQRIKAMIKDSPDLINAINPLGGMAPLHTAAQNGRLRVAKYLLDNGADVNRISTGKLTPLFVASQNGHRAMVELLISRGADVNSKVSDQTALHAASDRGFKAVAQVLLENEADVNAKNSAGSTPLHLAAIKGHEAVAELLLENDANINARDNDGRTALLAAVGAKNLEMAKFLVEKKADVNAAAKDNWTPLNEAVNQGQPKLVELLLQNGAAIEAKLDSGQTPLYLAANSKQKEIVKILLSSGASPNTANASGITPLHSAVNRGDQEIAELLLAHKADVNAKSLGGDTPLISGVKNLDKPMVELLLKHGANPNIATTQNETPLRIAQNQGAYLGPNGVRYGGAFTSEKSSVAKEIANLLIQYGADENYERRKEIAVRRNREKVYALFNREMNSWNRFSLLEAFGTAYKSHSSVGGSQFGQTWFQFPDLSKIKIHRLEGKNEREIPVNLEAILKSGDCTKDIWLEWGDIIEIPEKDHKLDEQWRGFPKELLEILPKCLARTVSIIVRGETKPIVLEPKAEIVSSAALDGGKSQQWFGPRGFDFWLNEAVSNSGLLRSSSDKTRVKVTRINPATKKFEEQIFNLENLDAQNNLWLRDGDQIEIPEKP